MLKVQGIPFSAHTRKVIITARYKGLDLAVDPLVPLAQPPEWNALSPLRKIPVLLDGDAVINDSSVICAYLDRRFPAPPIYPADPLQLARALWLEEVVDGDLAPLILHSIMREVHINPKILNQPTDHAVVKHAVEVALPPRLDYLEGQIDGEHLVGDQLTIADITLASILINLHYSGVRLDGERHGKLDRWLRTTLQSDLLRAVLRDERPFADKLGLDTASLPG